MLFSALLILHEAHILKQTGMADSFNHANRARKGADLVAKSREEVPESSLQRSIHSCVEDASPFLTPLLYLGAVAMLRIYRKEGSQESLDQLTTMKAALKDFDHRWRASGRSHLWFVGALAYGEKGAYLEILEAREISQLQ